MHTYFQQKIDELSTDDDYLKECYARLEDVCGSENMFMYINKLATFAVELYIRQNEELDGYFEQSEIIRPDN